MFLISRVRIFFVLSIALLTNPISCFADSHLQQLDISSYSHFFEDYSILKPVKSSDGTKTLRYTNLKFDPLSYKFIMINPVQINQKISDDTLQADTLDSTANALNERIRGIMVKKLAFADAPGNDTLVLSVSISGAEVDTEGFKPINILPISAIIKLGSIAIGKESRNPVLVVESKLTDSQTGELMRGSVITITGESFRNAADTNLEFQNLANKLVDLALKNIHDAGLDN